jgi:hypothetical protein
MTITLNGTTGITTPAETATTSVTTPLVTSPAATALTLQSAGTTAMTVDTSQNVGIGTTSPSTRLQVNGTSAQAPVALVSSAQTGTTVRSNSVFRLQSEATGRDVYMQFSDNVTNATEIGMVGGSQYFATAGAERMRIDSSGNLLVGTTNLSGTAVAVLSLKKAGGTTWQVGPATSASGNTFYVLNSSDVGVYLATGNTSWTAISDERLKTDLVPIENAASKVSSLRAVTGRFKTDEEGTSRAFLIAQEVQAVLPEAVDATNPDSLGVQYTDVIPLLVAAIKELSAKNDALEARLAALEAK